MKFIPASLTSKVSRQVLHLQKASPQVLFVGGVVGVVAAGVLACRATLKLEAITDNAHLKADAINKAEAHHNGGEYTEEDAKKDRAILKVQTATSIAKIYAPAVIIGAASICALTGSHIILNKRNAGLTAAYKGIERAFDEYRKRVETEVGTEREQEIRRDIKEAEITDADGKKKTVKVESGMGEYARYFDEHSSSWSRTPQYNLMFLKAQQQYATDRLRSRGHIFLNEVYDMIGLDHTAQGAVCGWVYDDGEGDTFVDFGFMDPDSDRALMFLNGEERSVLLNFNAQGLIYDLLPKR